MKPVSQRISLRRALSLCAVSVCAFTLCAPLTAQFYVDGSSGVDAPGRGTAALPWKTIGYAMANVPPITNPSQSDTIHVAGGQTYSAATNGEIFPITPAFNYALEGSFVGTTPPVIDMAGSAVGFRFAPSVFYNRSQVTFRYLEFWNGGYALRMGAAPTFRHRPQIQECTFAHQRRAGIRIDNGGSAIEDPRFYRNIFYGPARGIEIFAAGNGSVVQPDVHDNLFRDLGGDAVFLQDASAGGGNVGGTFRFNRFARCGRGIHLRTTAGAVTTNSDILHCLFDQIRGEGVYVEIDRPFDPFVTIRECIFTECGYGARMDGTPLPGPYSLDVLGSTFANCGVGIAMQLRPQQQAAGVSASLRIEDVEVICCTTGVLATTRGAGGAVPRVQVSSTRTRVLECAVGANIDLQGAGSCTWTNGMLCRNSGFGMIAQMSPSMAMTLRGLTLADNRQGLSVPASGTGSAIDHVIFDNVVADVTGVPGLVIGHSCFASSTWNGPGIGNLNRTAPRLIRPFYKLAPNSPCIDAGSIGFAHPATDYEGDPRIAPGRVGGPALPDLGADEVQVGGSIRPYGTASIGPFDAVPRLGSPSSAARIGSSITVELGGATFARQAIFALGLRDENGMLPFHLSGFGAPWSYLWHDYAAPIALQPVVNGTSSLVESIPAAPGLIGQSFTFEAFVVFGAELRTSNGLRVTIGQ